MAKEFACEVVLTAVVAFISAKVDVARQLASAAWVASLPTVLRISAKGIAARELAFEAWTTTLPILSAVVSLNAKALTDLAGLVSGPYAPGKADAVVHSLLAAWAVDVLVVALVTVVISVVRAAVWLVCLPLSLRTKAPVVPDTDASSSESADSDSGSDNEARVVPATTKFLRSVEYDGQSWLQYTHKFPVTYTDNNGTVVQARMALIVTWDREAVAATLGCGQYISFMCFGSFGSDADIGSFASEFLRPAHGSTVLYQHVFQVGEDSRSPLGGQGGVVRVLWDTKRALNTPLTVVYTPIERL